MRNTGLDEAKNGIKIAGRNINNLRYADGTTLMAESKGISEKHLLRLHWHTKDFDSIDHNKLWKILQEMGIPDCHAPWEICMRVKKQQLELDMEQQTGSK